jgi:hypothetical protein
MRCVWALRGHDSLGLLAAHRFVDGRRRHPTRTTPVVLELNKPMTTRTFYQSPRRFDGGLAACRAGVDQTL